jgi:hypothetical protein
LVSRADAIDARNVLVLLTQHQITGDADRIDHFFLILVSGDLMLSQKYQDIPGVDRISPGDQRPARRFYKVISSAAYNWDKGLVMSETYGAMGDIEWDLIYQVAMEQYTKGINQLIPHAVWYDDTRVTFKPELSWRHEKYADGLQQYNRYMSRLNVLLQNHGRHVADIAMLYPIATMQAGHHFEYTLSAYVGGVTIPEADYVEISELLSTQVGRDFTYLHPEVLADKCVLQGSTLLLPNEINHEAYKVMIMPAHKTISWKSLKKIKTFFDQGGQVIATGTLPSKSAEFGHDDDVAAAIKAMFPDVAMDVQDDASHGLQDAVPVAHQNTMGGMAVFIKKPSVDSLRQILDRMNDVYDVTFEPGQELRYIHKVVEGRDVYLFANLTDRAINTTVALKGHFVPELWDPHTGAISNAQYTNEKVGSVQVTKVNVALEPITSTFVVGR